MVKIKRQTGPKPQSVEGREFYADLLTMSNAQPQRLSLDWAPMSPAHAPATSAIQMVKKLPCQKHFFPFGPSFEGIEFLSRTIMTGKIFLRNR
jgi:hypothetical protein